MVNEEQPSTWSLHDRDLLIRLDANMDALRGEVSTMRLAIGGQIADHEARLRLQEAASDRNEGSIRAFRAMMAIGGTILVIVQIVITVWLAGRH